MNISRRNLLAVGARISGLMGAGAPLALNLAAASTASAQTANDYKAVICIFLYGGNDSFNTVLPLDGTSWNCYRSTRASGATSLALLPPGEARILTAPPGSPSHLGGVKPLTWASTTSRPLALNPLMTHVHGLLEGGRASIIGNIGPLIEPMTNSEYYARTRKRPTRLFSHNDQQNTWMSHQPEGARKGWGGLVADILGSQNNDSMLTAVSSYGNTVWLAGNTVKPYQIGSGGPVPIGEAVLNPALRSALLRAMQANPAMDGGSHLMRTELARVSDRSEQAYTRLRQTLPSPNDPRFGPMSRLSYVNIRQQTAQNPLALQLQTVARLIAARQALGMRRQVFFVGLGGFDTHDNQLERHANLLLQLDHGIGYLNNVLTEIGQADNVLTFTASDFGRTFTTNGDGTDHGWGAHHFVIGGGIQHGRIIGDLPRYGMRTGSDNRFDDTDYQIQNGCLIPTTSVAQLNFSIGRWLGASATDLEAITPYVSNFSSRDILQPA